MILCFSSLIYDSCIRDLHLSILQPLSFNFHNFKIYKLGKCSLILILLGAFNDLLPLTNCLCQQNLKKTITVSCAPLCTTILLFTKIFKKKLSMFATFFALHQLINTVWTFGSLSITGEARPRGQKIFIGKYIFVPASSLSKGNLSRSPCYTPASWASRYKRLNVTKVFHP